ncbi:hypothetical protein SPF06_19680 [Sinomonas sp. JGH33]|uniref:DUF4352 domain-containing protein n=1 Tax=Sinomonas terricola TaxID=3110330 RepID=A0ABU5TB76_9MICC|nr:hypothetical protein [Sinomonas sp. JGH33]MEA5456949.1 hypothetical protein [Sinomonas sp. JGH33]
MSERIAVEAITALNVAADRRLARKIKLLLTAVWILALSLAAALITLGFVIIPAHWQQVPLAMDVHIGAANVSIKEHQQVVYAQVDASGISDKQTLTYYFLYPSSGTHVTGATVTIGSDSFTAEEADGAGALVSEARPIIGFHDKCTLAPGAKCADFARAPYTGAAKIAVGVPEGTGVKILASADIPAKQEYFDSLVAVVAGS